MRWLLLLTLVSMTAAGDPPGRFARFCSRSTQGRSDRGFDCNDGAFFEAFNGGVGTTTACSTTPPTGAKGEVLTHARASSATCTKTATGGLATTGISVGDLVAMTNNQPRAEYDIAGVLGYRGEESAGTADDLRPEELDNVAWTSTATVTANAAVPPNNTNQVSNAEQLSDGSAAAFQGSCQTITTSSATLHTTFFHVRGGTATSAQVTQVGTGSSTGDCSATVTGLSGTTWDILSCTSPAAYAGTLTAVTICINVGNTVAVTGTIMVWGSDHKASAPYRTSYVPGRTSAGATRAAETASFPVALTTGADFSFAESYWSTSTSSACAGFFAFSTAVSGAALYTCFGTSANFRAQSVGTADSPSAAFSVFKWQTGIRWGGTWNRATNIATAYVDGVAGTPSPATPAVTSAAWSALSLFGDGIHSRLCGDPSQARCR